MSMPIEPAEGVLGRFEAINRGRLRRIREALSLEQVRFFDVLPLLFHVNRPGLPGYVSRETPAGIARYTPRPAATDAAIRLFRSAIGANEAQSTREILGIYCLGSLGSIAHSAKSDLDVWVCHAPGIETRRLAELNAKARVAEQWAQGLGLEVHFFLIDPERFRAGSHARLSAECSGNAQHYLLLDEFYRSSVVLAGLYPMWWMVPPAEENRYAECVARLQPARPEFVDLGGLSAIPREEFAGATLWQLGKVIDAPYKSVLKLLLLEAYASEFPLPDLLAMRYKAYIYGGAVDPAALDPYLLLYRRVEEYLERGSDGPRLALARRCLYFKSQEAQRHLPAQARAWRERCITALGRQWGWSRENLARLADRDRWSHDQVRAEWRDIVHSASLSCRVLSEFVRPLGGRSPVTAEEIRVLGRRLHAAFERRPGKFAIIGPGAAFGGAEERLCLHRRETGWGLSRGRGASAPLRTAEGPAQLIAWALLNGLGTAHTRWQVGETALDLTVAEVEALRDFIERGLVRRAGTRPAPTELNAAPRLLSAIVTVQVETEAEAEGEPRYRVRMAELILTTSWGERLCLHFAGDTALLRCLCEYLTWPAGRGDQVPIEAMVYGEVGDHAPRLAREFELLMGEAVTALRGEPRGEPCRYVLAWGRGYGVLEARDDAWSVEALASDAALLRYLGHPLPRFTRTLVQGGCGQLPSVFAANEPGVVQVFLSSTQVLVLDQHGALFVDSAAADLGSLGRYRRFLQAALYRAGATRPPVHCYAPGAACEPGAWQRLAELPEGAPAYTLRASGTPHAEAGRVFTLQCCGREFSEPGPSAYREAALHLLAAHAACPPVEVGDIDLPAPADGVPIIPLLQYRTLVEGRLNEALHRLRAERPGPA